MPVLKQGENYEETEDNNLEEQEESKPKKSKLPNVSLDLKLVIGIVIGVILVILLVYGFMSKSSNSDEVSDEFYDPIDDEIYENITEDDYEEPTYNLSFDDATRKRLRILGYTGDEIDYAYAQGIDEDELIETAEKDFEEAQLKELKKLANKSSNSNLKYLFNETQAGLKSLPVPSKKQIGGLTEERFNVDYKKVSPRGNQLYIKLDLGKMGTSFMQLDPVDYIKLKSSGNIVVDITYRKIGSNYYIVDMEEVSY